MSYRGIVKRMMMSGFSVPGFIKPVIRLFYRFGVFITEGFIFVYACFVVKPVIKSITKCGKGLRAERLPYIRGRGNITIGDSVNLSGRSGFYFMSSMSIMPEIRIGSNTFIGNACTLLAAENISIGSNCLISSEVRIQDNDGHPVDPQKRLDCQKITSADIKPVRIGNNVWIGSSAVILKGVAIGDNSVVGAASVVTKDIPPNVLVAGSPAIVIKNIS